MTDRNGKEKGQRQWIDAAFIEKLKVQQKMFSNFEGP